jgi:hypothetical protein
MMDLLTKPAARSTRALPVAVLLLGGCPGGVVAQDCGPERYWFEAAELADCFGFDPVQGAWPSGAPAVLAEQCPDPRTVGQYCGPFAAGGGTPALGCSAEADGPVGALLDAYEACGMFGWFVEE